MGILGSLPRKKKLKIIVLKYIVCILHILVLAAELHSPQSTAHPFQLQQDFLVSYMSANVLLNVKQLFPQVCTGSLALYDCNKAKYFSEKAASYIIHTLSPFLKPLSILAS